MLKLIIGVPLGLGILAVTIISWFVVATFVVLALCCQLLYARLLRIVDLTTFPFRGVDS